MSFARIIEGSVRQRGIVLAVWAAIVATAVASLDKLSIDAVPDVTNTQVSVLTSAPACRRWRSRSTSPRRSRWR
jgi:Cu/Ag efflux pump CusA